MAFSTAHLQNTPYRPHSFGNDRKPLQWREINLPDIKFIESSAIVQVDCNHNRYAIDIEKLLFGQLFAEATRRPIRSTEAQASHSAIVHFFNECVSERIKEARSLGRTGNQLGLQRPLIVVQPSHNAHTHLGGVVRPMLVVSCCYPQ